MTEYKRLAAAIILQAYKDSQKEHKNVCKYKAEVEEYIETLNPELENSHKKLRGSKTRLKKLANFYDSEWCECLCEHVGVDVDLVRQKANAAQGTRQ